MPNKPYSKGDHLVICDICGTQKYFSDCRYTWEGYLACSINDCWEEKHAFFKIPPVINDPQTLVDVRPDLSIDNTTFIETGHVSTWNRQVFPGNNGQGRIQWNQAHVKYGSVDTLGTLFGE